MIKHAYILSNIALNTTAFSGDVYSIEWKTIILHACSGTLDSFGTNRANVAVCLVGSLTLGKWHHDLRGIPDLPAMWTAFLWT